MATVKEKMTAIADAIRDKTGETNALTIDDMAEDIPKVYGNGYEKHRLEWWNAFTANNTRTYYTTAFRGAEDGSFDPPFAVKPINAEGMLREIKQKKITTEQLDLSACTNFPYGFYGTALEELGVIDLSRNGNNSSVFYCSDSLHTIEKVIFKEDGTSGTDATNLFTARKLTNLKIGGKIGKSTKFNHCPLTRESVMGAEGIVNALLDYAEAGETRTLTLSATTKGYLTESDIAIATEKGWTIA